MSVCLAMMGGREEGGEGEEGGGVSGLHHLTSLLWQYAMSLAAAEL